MKRSIYSAEKILKRRARATPRLTATIVLYTA